MPESLAQQARNVARAGRFGDTELLHINKAELAGLASLVPLTRNPHTGYPEAFLPFLLGIGLPALASTGALGATLGAVSPALLAGIGSGLGTLVETGDIGKGMMAGMLGYAGGSLLGGALGSGAGSAGAAGARGAASVTPQALQEAAKEAAKTAASSAAPSAPMNLPVAAGGSPAVPMSPIPPVRPVIGAGAAPLASPIPVPRPQSSGGIMGLIKRNPALAFGGAAALASAIPPASPKVPKSPRSNFRLERVLRDVFYPSPDEEGRENTYFGMPTYVPYREGGGVDGQDGRDTVTQQPAGESSFGSKGALRTFTPPQRPPVAASPDLSSPNFGGIVGFGTPPAASRLTSIFSGGLPPAVPFQNMSAYPALPSPESFGLGRAGGMPGRTFPAMTYSIPGDINELLRRPRGFAHGGAVHGYQDGGAPDTAVQDSEDRQIVLDAILALRGEHPNPEEAVRKFIERFGREAFESLLEREASGEIEETTNRLSEGLGGPVNAPGGPQDDMLPAVQPGAEAALSDGEFVVPEPMVRAIGNGDHQRGIATLESIRRQVMS